MLEAVRKTIEGEGTGARFRLEDQEYEQYVRRRFFEQMVSGQLPVRQIYEAAAALDLELRAQCYTIALFSALPGSAGGAAGCPEDAARIHDGLLEHFLKYPEYLLFRWTLTAYAVLIKGDSGPFAGYVRRCVETVRGQYETASVPSWYVAVGTPTQKLGGLPACFQEVSRLWAYRYIVPKQHILTADTVDFFVGTGGGGLDRLDAAKVNPAVLTGVLRSAGAEEIPDFVEEYVRGLGEALASKPFCQYLMLSVRFTAAEYAASLGVSQREFLDRLDCLDLVGQAVTEGELKEYIRQILTAAAALREDASGGQCRRLLTRAVRFIDSHYAEAGLSLGGIAQALGVSPNYLSALFSQEKGCTLTNYITARRMEKARDLLRTTDLRSGQVASAVGYRDPHYFSALFKRTQGCTPRDYRAGRDKQSLSQMSAAFKKH